MIEVEIEVVRADATYSVALRHLHNSELVVEPLRGVAPFDLAAIRAAGPRYGAVLGEQLFFEPALLAKWREVRDAARQLRVRLMIDRSASELHAVEWERLAEPARPGDAPPNPLLRDDNIAFSRFLFARGGRDPELGHKDDLRALVFVADPAELGTGNWNGLARIDGAAEERRARAALGVFQHRAVRSKPQSPASLDALVNALRPGCDVLYLICHGAAQDRDADARVFLEDGDHVGMVAVVRADQLAARIASLPKPPTLVVLASCESAGGLTSAALAGLGPKLVEAGVLAVVAMQGEVSLQTAGLFCTTLLRELRVHPVDEAVAIARNTVTGSDWWMPVLFSRLRRGRIWYQRGFATQEPWDDIVASIQTQQNKLTPIIGPGLIAQFLGTPAEITREFAEGFLSRAPDSGWVDLPRIAQVRAKINTRELMHRDITALLRRLAARRLDVPVNDPRSDDSLLRDAWCAHRDELQRSGRVDEHTLLASLPLPIYVTTNIDDTLLHALRATTPPKQPVRALFRWNTEMGRDANHERTRTSRPTGERPSVERPSVERPLVYHLFGHLSDSDSLVVSEDDFFDYLMWCRLEDSEIPEDVAFALKVSPLLLIGFALDDWRFRVMFRSIWNEHRRAARPRWRSVAAQVAPEESGVVPMRRYLEACFGDVRVEPFWGTVQDFITALAQRWQQGRRG